jgi:hypothetical protein
MREFCAGLVFGDDFEFHAEKGVALVEKMGLVVGRFLSAGAGA